MPGPMIDNFAGLSGTAARTQLADAAALDTLTGTGDADGLHTHARVRRRQLYRLWNRASPPIFRDTFADWSGKWTSPDSTLTLADDTTYVKTTDVMDGSDQGVFKSLKLTCVAGTDNHVAERSVSWNLGGNYPAGPRLILRVYIPEGAGDTSWQYIYHINLFLFSSRTGTPSITYQLMTDTTHHRDWGWHTLDIDLGRYYYKSAGFDPALDFATINKVRLNVRTEANTGKTPSVICDLLTVIPKPPFALVALCWDDSFFGDATTAASLNAIPMTDKKLYPYGHMLANFCTISSHLGRSTGYVTTAQAQAMADEGHLFANHGVSFFPAWESLTLAQKRRSIEACKVGLAERGLWAREERGGGRICATPGGHFRVHEDYELFTSIGAEGEIDLLRAGGTGYHYNLLPPLAGANRCLVINSGFDCRILRGGFDEPTGSDATLPKLALDRLIEIGGILVTVGHGTRGWHAEFFAYLAEKANAGQVQVVRLDEIVDMIDNQEPVRTYGVAHGHAAADITPTYMAARVATQFNKTSDATLADVPGLSVPLGAGKTYLFRAYLFVSCGAGGAKVAAGGNSGLTATAVRYDISLENQVTEDWIFGSRARWTGLGQTTGWNDADVKVAQVTGCITVNAAGNLTIQFAQESSNGTASSVLVGSHMIVNEVSA